MRPVARDGRIFQPDPNNMTNELNDRHGVGCSETDTGQCHH